MESNHEEAEECFFDSREEMGSADWDPDCSRNPGSPSVSFGSGMSVSHLNEVWSRELESVSERRSRFMKWIGWSSGQNCESGGELETECSGTSHLAAERLMYNRRAALRTSNSISTLSFLPSVSNEAFDDGKNEERLVIRNLDDGTEFVVDEIDQDGMLSRLHKVGSNFSLSFEEFQRAIGQSPMIQRFLSRCAEEIKPTMEKGKRVKDSWLKKFTLMARSSERGRTSDLQPKDVKFPSKAVMPRVRAHKKRSKELSSLFAGQEFMAHKGSIRTMKFSLDGLYLASGGEDGIMCVWKVLADERQDPLNSLASDPSCPYCTLHDTSGCVPHNSEKEKVFKIKRDKLCDSTCTVLPTKVFRVHEKPLHEFRGHNAEILDLSWSKKRLLLSASADSTVRLWQVGSEGCLGVFRHTNYVTSVDFNPLDDNYFISGSLDGKVRIWEAKSCRVAGYTDIKDIVTAVRYRPNGKGGLVGSVSGNCLFYTVVDNQLQLDANFLLQGKKKLPSNRITGFQFSPKEPNKVVVTCADSVVRVLCGTNVVCKFKVSGLRVTANQMHASFTSDGKHIISMSDDSNIYIWNYNSQSATRVKSIREYESFSSENALIAIPWSGIETIPDTCVSSATCKDLNYDEHDHASHHKVDGDLEHKMDRSPQDWFSLTRGFLLESLTKGSATWPEEKFPIPIPLNISRTKCAAHYKLLKSACQNMLTSSHMWGLMIVTAGLDGRIRTYLNYGLPLRL